MTRTVRVRIEGDVQGVGFRDWTSRTASGLGLNGWVRNRRDGSVEAVFEGSSEIVDEMIARCRRGPSMASVANLEILDEPSETFHTFEIHPTA